MNYLTRNLLPGNDFFRDRELSTAKISLLITQITHGVGLPEGKVWVVLKDFPDEYRESGSTEHFFVQSINTIPKPLENIDDQKGLDQIAYDLVKLGDEIKEVFFTFDFCQEELHDLNALLFSRRKLPKVLLELNMERFFPLELVSKTLIRIFSDTDEGIELLNIEMDLPGTIEEKYQIISGIEEWILDNCEDIFEDIMITNSLR